MRPSISGDLFVSIKMNKGVSMIFKSRFVSSISILIIMVLIFSVSGCNRSALRIPGASLSFPETPTGHLAKKSYPYVLVIPKPVDKRSQHYGERVAGTKWTGCSTDPLWGSNASEVIQQRLVKEFQASGLFSEISTTPTGPNDIIMETEIHAFCSQSIGFLIIRVAGISSLRVTMRRNDKTILARKFEKIVTDADKEYTGSQVTMIEQAMSVTMADSLRELLKNMLRQVEVEMAA